ncbi:response regulator (plasmid) [Microvirga sp. RSM25]|uniref:response regulator n=1 Tax=Microvirga sp. RSM25 TaxID=3273802 RepID=UPI00384C16F3
MSAAWQLGALTRSPARFKEALTMLAEHWHASQTLCDAPKMLALSTVLVVDNDPITRELLERVLQTAGCRVLAVPRGNAGLLSLCQQQACIDWLVPRVKLPGLIDGWLLADEYHRHHPDRPVILLSNGIAEAECPSIDALFIPPTAPMRVLETLKSLVDAETSRLVNSPAMARAA